MEILVDFAKTHQRFTMGHFGGSVQGFSYGQKEARKAWESVAVRLNAFGIKKTPDQWRRVSVLLTLNEVLTCVLSIFIFTTAKKDNGFNIYMYMSLFCLSVLQLCCIVKQNLGKIYKYYLQRVKVKKSARS